MTQWHCRQQEAKTTGYLVRKNNWILSSSIYRGFRVNSRYTEDLEIKDMTSKLFKENIRSIFLTLSTKGFLP